MQGLMTQKIVIFREMSSMNVDFFRYLVLAGNFPNFGLCKIQLGAQCLLGFNLLFVPSMNSSDHIFESIW